MATTVIGIDPGASGGFAWIDGDTGERSANKFDGLTEHDIAAYFGHIRAGFAFIEQVTPNRNRDTGGGRAQGSSGMFTFGQSYGFLRGLLVGMHIPFESVRPQVWLPAMGLRGIKDETTTQKKNRHKAKAQQLWPQLAITHAICDALLLAEFGRRKLADYRNNDIQIPSLREILAT